MRLGAALVLWAALATGCGGGSDPAASEPDTEAVESDGAVTEPDALGAEPDALGAEPDVARPAPDLPEVSEPLGYAPCPVSTHVGGFQITLADAYTGADGQIYDGIVPGNVPEEVEVAGDCRLLRARSLFCDPACVPGETCGDDGACVDHPERVSVGLVTITGLVDALSMEAKWGNTYTNPGSMTHPGYESGADIALSAEGGDFEGFSLRGFGVEALSPSGGSQILIEEGTGIDLSWAPPTVDGPAKVHIELNLNNHGSTSAWIACDVADTGGFTIPAALLDALYAIGVSGFPSLAMSRRSVDSASISLGCVDLMVVSEQEVSVEIDGIISCTKDQQCPQGQTCGADLACH